MKSLDSYAEEMSLNLGCSKDEMIKALLAVFSAETWHGLQLELGLLREALRKNIQYTEKHRVNKSHYPMETCKGACWREWNTLKAESETLIRKEM